MAQKCGVRSFFVSFKPPNSLGSVFLKETAERLPSKSFSVSFAEFQSLSLAASLRLLCCHARRESPGSLRSEQLTVRLVGGGWQSVSASPAVASSLARSLACSLARLLASLL